MILLVSDTELPIQQSICKNTNFNVQPTKRKQINSPHLIISKILVKYFYILVLVCSHITMIVHNTICISIKSYLFSRQ